MTRPFPDVMPEVFDRTDLTPRERLLAAFEIPASTPLCPYIAAAVELHDAQHPASQYARDYKTAIAPRLTETARDADAANPEELGEQLALLIDAAARTRVLNSDSFPTAAATATVLIANAIPTSSPLPRNGARGVTVPAPVAVESNDRANHASPDHQFEALKRRIKALGDVGERKG